jgi:hypothetical protein
MQTTARYRIVKQATCLCSMQTICIYMPLFDADNRYCLCSIQTSVYICLCSMQIIMFDTDNQVGVEQ